MSLGVKITVKDRINSSVGQFKENGNVWITLRVLVKGGQIVERDTELSKLFRSYVFDKKSGQQAASSGGSFGDLKKLADRCGVGDFLLAHGGSSCVVEMGA
jgi:hypothetical protein